MREVFRLALTLLVYCLALPLGAGAGYSLFRLVRGTRWPTIVGRYVATALASVFGVSVFLTTFWALGLAGELSRDGTPPTLGELLTAAVILGSVYAAFFVLRYTQLGRRLNRPIRWRRGA